MELITLVYFSVTEMERLPVKRTMSTNTASPYFIDVGDLNQDSRLDLVVASKGTNDIGVFLGSKSGTFVLSKMYSTGTGSSISLALGDLNNDHRLDVIAISNDTGAINILIGTYEGFSNQTTYSTGSCLQYL